MLRKIGDSLKGKKLLPWLILAPLALIFAFWGATGMVSMDFLGAQTWAAKVNGKPVPLQEANDVWRNQQSQWQQQFGTDIPDDVRAELQEGVLERLIRARLVGDRSQGGGSPPRMGSARFASRCCLSIASAPWRCRTRRRSRPGRSVSSQVRGGDPMTGETMCACLMSDRLAPSLASRSVPALSAISLSGDRDSGTDAAGYCRRVSE